MPAKHISFGIHTVRTVSNHYVNGIHTVRTYSYRVGIDEEKLPKCPLCNERPPHNQLDVTIYDQDKGTFKASVLITKTNPKCQQRTFEKVYALYNSFQGILGLLQQTPEFSGGVTLLRRFMIVSDVAMGVIANHYLIKSLEEKGQSRFLGIVPAALAAIPLFLGLERLFDPEGDPSQLTLKGVTAQWERPFYERAHLAFNAYRLLTTLGLTFFSKANQAFNVTSLLSQVVGLVGAMNVKWLRVDQSGLGALDAEFCTYAIVPSTLSKTAEGMKGAIAYIADLQQRIVNDGTTTIVSHYNNGVMTHQTLKVRYTMEKVQDLREYLFKPFVWTWEGLEGAGRYFFSRLSLSVELS